MTGTPKYVQIAEVLQRRIAHGDYLSGALPGAPKLMQEFGISYMTTRQAMQKLIDDGTVIRAANGRLEVPGALGDSPKLRVAYLHHSAIALSDKWRNAIAGAACKYGCSYQDIPFRYSEDAVVYETLDQDFDMIFFNISPLHPLLLEKLRRRSDRMISLFNDLTCYGIRCFDGINIEAIGHLVKFLHQRGCRRIDFFTVEPNLNRPSARQLPWERALTKYGCTGMVWDDRTTPPEPSLVHAIHYADRLVRAGKLDGADAIFCTTVEATRGLIRALRNHGIRVPEDIAVVSFGSPEQARVHTPSITIVNTPDLMPLVSKIYEHYLGITPAPERLYYRFELEDLSPEEVLWIGESTAADYHHSAGRRSCFSAHRAPFLTQKTALAETSSSLPEAENDH